MFSMFFFGIQQDLKMAVLAPVLCAILRLIFILVHGPKKSPTGEWRKWYECFRYGFWWGMDTNAKFFLYAVVLITLPSTFIGWYYDISDYLRLGYGTIYLLVIYVAFIGRMIFYYHYHDIWNSTLLLGKNAEKHNLLDVFFNQDHGAWLLLSLIPAGWLSFFCVQSVLGIPFIDYAAIAPENNTIRYGMNIGIILLIIIGYYFCYYGGSFHHENKPEWDEIPAVVKRDPFMSRATPDDLPMLKVVLKNPLASLLTHTDEEDAPAISRVVPTVWAESWQSLPNPVEAFRRKAEGAHIDRPRNIYLIVGESYSQIPLDDAYAEFHIMDGAKRLRAEAHTAQLSNFLPAGKISRPAIVSLMTGIFDARLELNEREIFWHGTVASTLPRLLKRLGYESIYWYGGNPTYGNFDKFGSAIGFDKVMGATEFCPAGSPRTWVGIYDHIFLEETVKLLKEMDDTPRFHFVYTTSNHGPYKMNLSKLGFDIDAVMPNISDEARGNDKQRRILGTHWYSDRAISKFIDDIRELDSDALVIVTGDHSYLPVRPGTVLDRKDYTLREQYCTSFAMTHPGIDQSILVNNTIGGHMNILPTIMELIAPKNFEYLAMMDSLTQPIERVITPYHWMTREAIGRAEDSAWQYLAQQDCVLHQDESGKSRFFEDTAGFEAVTGWMVRHPELLDDVGRGKHV